MSVTLLPSDFEDRCAEAVQLFWNSRTQLPGDVARQGGSRDAVTSGKNMDGFVALAEHVARHVGLRGDTIHTRSRDVVLPGYYRPTKRWDALVIDRGRLLAVFEFKSQVGSFGNNFNNRSEEAIGSAADLWVAYKQGGFQRREQAPGSPADDPRPPFVGWLMLLEDCEASRTEIKVDEPHYPVFPEFVGASYARRYQLLCERLMQEKLYSAASLLFSRGDPPSYSSLSEATSVRSLYLEFASKIAAAVQSRASAP